MQNVDDIDKVTCVVHLLTYLIVTVAYSDGNQVYSFTRCLTVIEE